MFFYLLWGFRPHLDFYELSYNPFFQENKGLYYVIILLVLITQGSFIIKLYLIVFLFIWFNI